MGNLFGFESLLTKLIQLKHEADKTNGKCLWCDRLFFTMTFDVRYLS